MLTVIQLCAVTLLLAAPARTVAGADGDAASANVDVTLRLQWICDSPRTFDGRIVADQGVFSDIANLSMDAGTTGGFWTIEQGRGVRIAPRGPCDRLGFDVRYVGPRSGKLMVSLDLGNPRESRLPEDMGKHAIEIPLDIASLIHGEHVATVSGGVRFWVGRAAGDALRIRVGDGASMVFSAGQRIPVTVSASAVAASPSRGMELKLALQDDATTRVQWQKTVSLTPDQQQQLAAGGKCEIAVDTLALPEHEGVYTLLARLVPAAGDRLVDRIVRPDLFAPVETIAERKTQMVVLEPLPPAVDPTPLAEIARLDLTGRGWMGFGGSGQSASAPLERAVVHDQSVAVLPGGCHVALPLPVAGMGKPHVLVVRYPRAHPVKMELSIRQGDGSDQAVPLGVDTAVVDDAAGDGLIESDALWGEHRVVYWPRVKRPVLVMTNADERAGLQIESIRVEVGPARLGGGMAEAGEGRLAAVYLDKPLLAEAFGAPKAIDPSSGLALDDWNTFLQAGRRLVDYVQYCGANGAIVTVVGEGGALYPVPGHSSTPRYDTGVFFSDGRDPVRKDVLELLMRLFDRSGLHLVPSVELATPLTALEQQLEDPRQAVGLELVDSVARRYVDGHPPRHGLAPYYNILDPRVEHEVRAILEDLNARYARHRSFRGVGIHVGPQTYLQLPPPQWGRDARTLERLRRDWEAALRMSDRNAGRIGTPAALNAFIDTEASTQFIAWRANELTQLYRRLAAQGAGRPLVLLTADYLAPELDSPGGGALACGLDWTSLSVLPEIIPMRLIRERLLVDPARRIDDAKMNEDLAWDQALDHGSASTVGTAGGLIFRPPGERLVDLPASFGQGAAQERITTFAQALPAGQGYGRRLARPMETFDPQIIAVGGWMPAFGQEEAGRRFLTTFRVLPREPFQSVPPVDGAAASVKVRQLRTATRLVVYAVNTGMWGMNVEIATDAAAGTPVRTLGVDATHWTVGTRYKNSAQAPVNGVGTTWAGVLGAGEMVALEVLGPTSGVASWTAVPVEPDRLARALLARVEDLNVRVSVLGRPRLVEGFVGGGFEQGDENQITGWLRAQHPPGCIRFDSSHTEGKRSVVLSSDSAQGSRTWLLSEPVPASETGRMAVSLRARHIQGTPRIRLALEGQSHGTAVRHSVEIEVPSDGQWPGEPYWLRVPSLPPGKVQDLRIAIDLISPGEIAIDDVRLYDFFLTDRERSDLQRQTFVALERLRRGDFVAAGALLDSHWARYLRWLRVPSATGDDGGRESSRVETRAGGGQSQDRGTAPNQSVPVPEETAPVPGVAERLRGWLPETLRF